MNVKLAYEELAEQVKNGEELITKLSPNEGLSWKQMEWGENVKTIIATIDPYGQIFDRSTPVGMFYEGWNIATFHWTNVDGKTQKERNNQGFAQSVGALKAIVKYRPMPREKDSDGSREEIIHGKDVFVIHGHDIGARETIARFIEKLGLKAVILHEMENQGKTIIEKFESYSNVGYAVAILTRDDFGGTKLNHECTMPRARQNVVFEFGYFMGKLGRSKVCALVEDGIERPSDLDGIVYISLDSAGGWKLKLAGELKKEGFDIKLDNIV